MTSVVTQLEPRDLRDAEIAELRDQVRRWREHAGHMRDQVIECMREAYRLHCLIETHNDERRECPVIEH
jgi:hypothetical protein